MSGAPGSSQPPPSAVLSLDADESGAGDAASSGPAQTVTLISKEGHRLQVARQALMASELCKTTLEGDKDATEIPLYHIEGAIVAKVIEYLTYHLAIPARKIDKPLLSNNMRDLVDKWDVQFIEGEQSAAGIGGGAATAGAAGAGVTAATTTSAAASAAAATLGGSAPSSAAPSAAAAAVTAAAASAPSAAAQEVLFKLLLAANYLNIRSLLQLTCAKVASLMKGKTPDQIRAVFNIRNDYTQAEEEEVRKEYKDLIG